MNTPKLSKKVTVPLPKVRLLKHQQEVSIRSLLVFLIAFGLIGYLLFRTFAAAPLVASLEGENMLPSTAPTSSSVNLALNKPATASSLQKNIYPASSALDGKTNTRWSSQYSDPQWLRVDLGSVQSIGRVVIQWEGAYGKAYQIQTSNDGTTWTTVYSTTTGNGGTDDLTVAGSGRYVRMYGTSRGTKWGYSIWEMQVYSPSITSISKVVSDTAASNGQEIKLHDNGTVSGSFNLPSNASSMAVIARADLCDSVGAAMTVKVDGSQLISTTVNNTSLSSFSANTNLAAGSHQLAITFSNDEYMPGVCDRNLYVDITNFYGPVAPPPVPTVALSASPTSVTSGQSSTLTWTSTNATSCTASGAWSGNEPTSGSMSTGAINQSSTYTLTCTGSGGSATASVTVTANPVSTSCTTSATLVNSCRPWLGAFAANYPQVSGGFKAQVNYQEQRIGRQADIVHNYHPSGSNNLSADDIALATRTNTYLYINWKPTSGTTWAATGSGSNSTANTGIDNMASSIKSIAPAKVMVALWGEPERSTSNSPTCGSGWPNYKSTASGYSTTDYVNMWHNVRNRFNADGVTNVVWVMNYMGLSKWQCMQKDLWPGNSYVDWVMWDPYASDSETFASSMGYFYNWMSSNSDSSHDFNSKGWGLAEYGSYATNQSTVYSYYDSIKSAIDNNTYPKLKAYIEFDNVGVWDTRVLYNWTGDGSTSGQLSKDTIDNTEQSHYKALADDPRLTDAFYTSQ